VKEVLENIILSSQSLLRLIYFTHNLPLVHLLQKNSFRILHTDVDVHLNDFEDDKQGSYGD
jgi:hypothetical protein